MTKTIEVRDSCRINWMYPQIYERVSSEDKSENEVDFLSIDLLTTGVVMPLRIKYKRFADMWIIETHNYKKDEWIGVCTINNNMLCELGLDREENADD